MSKLPKSLTTVTPLSKTIALIIFIMLPIMAFVCGYKLGVIDGMLQALIH